MYVGNAGGFAGSLLNGTVKDSAVVNLASVNAKAYGGGFIGHMGKSGAVDIDKVEPKCIRRIIKWNSWCP